MTAPQSRQESSLVPKFRTILVPTDFSEEFERAFRMAVQLAKAFGAKVSFMHSLAVPPPVPTTVAEAVPMPAPPDATPPELRQATQDKLDRVVQRGLALNIRCAGDVLFSVGQPHHAILESAKAWDADLIVMGTHGRSGLARLVLGSTTEAVIRHSPIPVLVVPAGTKH
jgi:universal stress protein A